MSFAPLEGLLGGSGYGGLLSPDDQTFVRNQGLLNLAGALLSASGPSRTPISLGQALGQGVLGMGQAQNSAVQGLLQGKILAAKAKEAESEANARDKLKEIIGSPGQTYTGSGEGMTKDIPGTGYLGGKTDLPGLYAQMAGLGGEYSKLGIAGLSQLQGRDPLEAAKLAETIRHNKASEAAQNPLAIFNGMGGSPTSPQGASGDEMLSKLPPQIGAQVKALAEGRMQFPGGFALKSPYWQQMINLVAQYDPSFDAVNYNARAKTRNDFTSGKSAQSINALNTVIGHLDALSNAADSLNNTSIPAYNSVANFLSSNSGDPRVKQFNTVKKAVVDELTRAYRGAGGSEGDIKSWAENIDAANSPAQLHGVIKQMGDLLESKVTALGDQYNQGMGTTSNPISLVSPKAREVLTRLEQRSGTGLTQKVSGAQPNAMDNGDFRSLWRR